MRAQQLRKFWPFLAHTLLQHPAACGPTMSGSRLGLYGAAATVLGGLERGEGALKTLVYGSRFQAGLRGSGQGRGRGVCKYGAGLVEVRAFRSLSA